MFGRAWQWACKHKWAIGAVGAAAGGALLYSGYHVLQQQERWIRERKLAQHREQMLDASLENAMDLCVAALPHVQQLLQEAMPVPTVAELRDATHSKEREEKVRIWVAVIVAAFTRLIAGAYVVTLHSLLTRAQVVLLSRYMILHVHERSAAPADTAVDEDASAAFQYAIEKHTQHTFMRVAQYIKSGAGVQQLLLAIKREVEDLIQSQSIAKKCTHADVVQMIERVRHRIERPDSSDTGDAAGSASAASSAPGESTPSPLLQFLLPPEGDYDHMLDGMHDKHFDALLNELRNIFDTGDFALVLESSLDAAFKNVCQDLSDIFTGTVASDGEAAAADGESARAAVPLVQISSSLKRHADAMVSEARGRHCLERLFRAGGAAQWAEAVLSTGLPR